MTRSKDLFRYSILALAASTLMACNDNNSPLTPPVSTPAPAPVPAPGPATPTPTPAPTVAADTYVLTGTNKLIGFAVSAPNVVSTVNLAVPAAETLLGGDFRPVDGLFYIVTRVTADNSLKAYTVNVSTGALGTAIPLLNNGTGAGGGTAGAPITLTGTKVGVDFNPVANALRIIDGNGVNIRSTLAAGNNTFIDAPISAGLAEAAYTNTFAATCQTDLYYISGTQLFLTGAPNGVATNAATPRLVGNIGLTADANSGFDIRTTATGNVLTTALKVGGAYSVYELSATTGGSVVNRGAIGGLATTDTVLGLVSTLPTTAPANAAGNMLAITAGTTQNLVTFNRAPQGSPNKLCSTAAITGLTAGDVIVGADTRPATGALTALAKNGTAGRIYTINPATAAATAVASLSTGGNAVVLSGSNFGVDFNPVPDRLRVVGDDGQNLRVNVADGTTTVDTALTSATGGAARSGVSAVGYTNSLAGGNAASLTTTLYGLDSTTDMLVRIGADPGNATVGDAGNPNAGVVTDLGALGVDIGAVNAFDIIGSNGTALMAATVGTTSTLYTVSLATGAATRVQDFASPIVAMGPSAGTARTATVFAVTTANNLVSFAPATPGTVTTIGAIGVPAGETVLGIDFRPSIGPKNGQLVALTSAGKLYEINPTSAAATLLSTLSGTGVAVAATDEHGIDFNPLPDRVRTISVNGNNLRSAVETGVTTNDTTTTQTGIFGAGYTNAFTTAPSTTLYVLRSAGTTDELARVGANPGNGTAGDAGNPNSGVVTSIGVLGFDTSNIGDLDIAGGQNGFVLAALQPSAGGLSGLYRINLTSGSAGTKIADIATGGDAVRGIAIQLK